MALLRSLGGEAQAVRERTARAFQRYATLSAATHRLEEQADEEHAKQVVYSVDPQRMLDGYPKAWQLRWGTTV